MARDITAEFYRKIIWDALLLFAIMVIGTIGYYYFGEEKYSILDCFYMTVITISTIGYTEIVDLSNNPWARVFNIGILAAGIGTMTYFLTSFTAFIVEGKLSKSFSRKKMDKIIANLKDHFIVCGGGHIGVYLLHELVTAGHPIVLIDINPDREEELRGDFPDLLYITGDATRDSVLQAAGIDRAVGLFANTLDDSVNLMVVLSAKHLNPKIRVVAQCQNPNTVGKLEMVGSDVTVVPHEIGGTRMASEMINPRATSFLAVMLKDQNRNLSIEEVTIPPQQEGLAIADLDLKRFPNVLVLAIRHIDDWTYNPPRTHTLEAGDTLVLMTTPEERKQLEKSFILGSAPTHTHKMV